MATSRFLSTPLWSAIPHGLPNLHHPSSQLWRWFDQVPEWFDQLPRWSDQLPSASRQDLKDPPWILLRARPKCHEALQHRKHHFYLANRLVLKIGCQPRAPATNTISQTYRFAYAKPLLLSGTGTLKNLESAESSKQQFWSNFWGGPQPARAGERPERPLFFCAPLRQNHTFFSVSET